MSNLELLEHEITSWNVNRLPYPDIVDHIVKSIPSTNIPYRMKLALAINEVIVFVSQFRINILHWNESIIPINSIMFVVARSGASKDSSLRYARMCFGDAYKDIKKFRVDNAVKAAIAKAMQIDGHSQESASRFQNYKKYYEKPSELFISISTPEGFMQYMADLQQEQIGAGIVYDGEFGQSLQTNQDITGLFKIISELYDMGNRESKMLKDKTNITPSIESMPASGLFQTSHDTIIYEENVKKKFRIEFTSKLARRCFFIFANEKIMENEYISIPEMIAHEKDLENLSIQSRQEASTEIQSLTSTLLEHPIRQINVSDAVRELFIVYKKYNEAVAEKIDHRFPITKLSRQHMQWKCLKLAGAFALIERETMIKPYHYFAAVKFSESIFNDINNFEKEMQKEPYEMFIDYAHECAIDGSCSVSIHNMRKLGFITNLVSMDKQIKELARLANSCDNLWYYEIGKDNITAKELKLSNKILLSWLYCTGTKQERVKNCSQGYQTDEIHFKSLLNMLKDDYAYSPFRFKNGTRGKANITSGCKWIVMDVDDSDITDTECHLLLDDINHIIVRTSNPDVATRYRVILELDMEVDVKEEHWTRFIQLIGEDMGIKADKLPKSQIFFSYKGRTPLYHLEGSCITTKDYLTKLDSLPELKIPNKQEASRRLEVPFDTFKNAFEAPDKCGKRKIIWAMKYARELGANKEYCLNLLQEINNYWVKPLPDKDFETIKKQIERWSF